MQASTYSARRPLIFGLVMLFILVAGFGTWAITAKLAGAIVASGQVVVDQNRQVVQHLDGGMVDKILVKEGDRVEAGALLVRLDPARLQSELTIIEGQYFELLARLARLEAERDGLEAPRFSDTLISAAKTQPEVQRLMEGQVRLFTSRRDTIDANIAQLTKRKNQVEQQIEGFEAQSAALEQQLVLLKKELADQQTLLAKQLTQAARVLALQREVAATEGQLGELKAAKAEAEVRITETELQATGLKTQRREEAIAELRDSQASARDLAEQRRAVLRRLERLDLRAPVSGIIYGLQVFAEKSVIQPAQPVLYLVPTDRPLVIATQVEPIHIDQVYVGQQTILQFPAFNSRTTPDLYGHVVTVSADAFSDEATGMSFYRAEIELDEGELLKLPETSVLVPGMPVSAFIRTIDRSPMSYLLQPFTDYFRKALRES